MTKESLKVGELAEKAWNDSKFDNFNGNEYDPFIAGFTSGHAAGWEKGMEDALSVCLDVWKNAENTKESGYRQNQISHGCIASSEAIRALKESQNAKHE